MLQSEFESLWGKHVPVTMYKEVIEPMYLATPEYYSKVDFVNMLEPPLADEHKAFTVDGVRSQKSLFVKNLGWLLSQTRLDIYECEYAVEDGEEFAIVRFQTGEEINVNITADSYVAIIRDVCKKL